MNYKKIINDISKTICANIGEHNFGLLLSVLADSIEYTMGEKGVKNVRTFEVIYNDFFRTKADLTDLNKEYEH